ncbi:MAG: hypothetical protein LBB83_07190 [Treponema sp.]|nr:hypothetical protein [Treponema sp.]
MKITNLFGLPEALVNAVSVRPHNAPGSLSATTLLKNMKQILLTERHWDELEEDVLDRFWALFGSAIHKLLEHEGENDFSEESMFCEFAGIKVTGQIDLYNKYISFNSFLCLIIHYIICIKPMYLLLFLVMFYGSV